MIDGPPALARIAAEWLVARLGEAEGTIAVALSGGSTPKLLYQLLAAEPFRSRVPWDRVHWFWGDERFVPPDDPASNYRMALDALFRHVPVTENHIHPIPTTSMGPADAAASYEDTLREFHGSDDLSRPLFHVVLLGLGTNGHFASLFPDTPSLGERRAWAVPVTPLPEDGPNATPQADKTRITLTYPALESCRHAAFLVAGADKRDVLARVRAGEPDLPASHYHPSGALHWLTDDAAEGETTAR